MKKQVEKLLSTIKEFNPKADTDIVQLAYDFAEKAHEGQTRMSGEPYIIHPLAAAQILAEMNVHTNIIVAALLHDVPEDTDVSLETIEKNFGTDVASMVAGITKLGKIKYRGVERYIENLRKMFVAMAEDARVILIKCADRLHNLQTLDALPPKKRYRIALESLEIFAPIANRLGMGEVKGQLEDYAFKYVYPKEYEDAKKILEQKTRVREAYFKKVIKQVKKEIEDTHIAIDSIHWRKKHLYSFYQKLQRHNNDVTQIHDVIALRIIVNSESDCYAVLGVIHKLWKPLKGRIKDYISQPKPNGYQSLHTTVFCMDGEIVEFQIRTKEMNEAAEYGIAAHFFYDENGSVIPDKKLLWIQELAKMQKDLMQRLRDIDLLKVDVFKNRIFVFTPKGDVIDLPEDATPVDLAYAIHTDIGNTCTGARVNHQMVPLTTALKSSDVVEIITDKNRKGPSADWLKFVKTNQARSKIKSYTKQSSLLGFGKFFDMLKK